MASPESNTEKVSPSLDARTRIVYDHTLRELDSHFSKACEMIGRAVMEDRKFHEWVYVANGIQEHTARLRQAKTPAQQRELVENTRVWFNSVMTDERI